MKHFIFKMNCVLTARKKLFSYVASALIIGLGLNSCSDQNPPSGGGGETTISNQYVAKAFSIGADKKVVFAQGNLQYNAKQNVWRFAELQYDTIGKANQNIAPDYDGWIDIFGWGTGKNPTQTSNNDADYSTFEDWGQNPISNGGNLPNQWRTLKTDEWLYLFKQRANYVERLGFGSVNGIGGLIILPDEWSLPAGLTFYTWKDKGFIFDGNFHATAATAERNGYTHNVYTPIQWKEMEKAGAVFLPAAGERNQTTVSNVNYAAYYFHADNRENETNAAAVIQLFPNSVSPVGGRYKRFHGSVRLAQDVE